MRNPRFVGRGPELERLERTLAADGIQAVVGAPGVGKTALAIEYVHRHADRYRLISWLRAHRRETVTRFGAPLRRERDTLIVLDDARPEVVRECLPAGPGQVLITSRETGWSSLAGTMTLAPLDEPEASALLLADGPGDRRAAGALVSALHRLPLALELAARFARTDEPWLEEYLERFTRRRGEDPIATGAEEGLVLVAACGLSYETVASRRPPATVVLDSAAFLDADHIPLSLLDAGTTGQLPDVLTLLDQFGLIERLPDGLRMARVIQEFVRTRLTRDEKRLRAQEVLATLTAALSPPSEDPAAPRVVQLLPHVLALAEVGTSLQCAPQPTAQLWNVAGRLLQESADHVGAREAFAHALAVLDGAPGPQHASTATVASNLGTVLEDMGDGEGAREAFARAVAVAESAQLDPGVSGRVLSNYGAFLERDGRHDEAVTVMGRALQALRAASEPSEPEIAAALNTLGLALADLGEYEEAKASFRQSLGLHEAAFGHRHPKVATVLNNLGLVHQAAGQHREARSLHERALAIDEAALGSDHPDVSTDLNNLGLALQGLDDQPGARRAYERALRIVEGAYATDDLRIAVITTNLGLAQHAAGDYQQAKAAHERALRITEAALGPDHPGLRNLLNNLGAALQALGDHQGARAAFERALRLGEAALGPAHPDLATALVNLGHALHSLGDTAGARSALRRGLHILRQFVTGDHPLVLAVCAALEAVEGRSVDGGPGTAPS